MTEPRRDEEFERKYMEMFTPFEETVTGAAPAGLLREALAQLIAAVVADAKNGRVPDDRSTVWPAYVRGYINGVERALAAPPTLNDEAYFAAHGHEPYCPADYLIPEGPCDCRAARLSSREAGG